MTKQTVESRYVETRSVESSLGQSRLNIRRPYFDWKIDGPKAALIFFLFLPLLLSTLLWPPQFDQSFWQPMSLGAGDLVGSCIEGEVTDQAGNPIQTNWTILATPLDRSGTPIDSEAITVLSDLTGRFRFRRPLLPAGDWQFMIILPEEWIAISPQKLLLTLEDDQSGCRAMNFVVDVASQEAPTDTPTIVPSSSLATATSVSQTTTRQSANVDPGGGGAMPTASNTSPAVFLPAPTKTPQLIETPTSVAGGGGSPPLLTAPAPQNQPENQPAADDGRADVSVLKIDDSHQPLAGWIIRAESAPDYLASNAIKVTTGQDGIALFRLDPGKWTFIEEAPSNITYEPIVPDTDHQTLAVRAPGPYTIRFKNRITGPGCIEVYKYDLPPGNGQPFGLEGWQINVSRADGTPVTGGKTNALGQIRFEDLAFGSYSVSEETRAGWSPVTPPSLAIDLTELDCKLVTFFNKQIEETDDQPTPIPGKTPNGSQSCTECHTEKYPKPKKPVYKPETLGYGKHGGGNDSGGGSGCYKMHTVGNGEWIYNIARGYGISAQSLYNANPWVYQQYNHFLYPGQRLCIPRW